ncbi:hypothetical protein JR338_10555 [Chloroflexota bacterium]|nr:hypothetical protein JR338_10555 [Chloroflexota bacterium]
MDSIGEKGVAMKTSKRWVLMLLTVCMLFSLSACSWLGIEGRLNPISTQKTASAITALVRSQPFPEQYYDAVIYDPEVVFDPNQLLEALTHLRIKPGYTLDFVYYLDFGFDTGYSIVYSHKTSEPRFETVEEYQAQLGECDPDLNPTSCECTDFIETDGTKAGYFEFVLFDIMRYQIYRIGHAQYGENEVITSKARLDVLSEEIGSPPEAGSYSWGNPFTDQQKRRIRQIDPVPRVIILDEEVTVRVVIFSRWGGFYEVTVTLAPDMPHTILNIDLKNLIMYDCGIMF